MTKVLAGITTSVDGYVAGPKDRAGTGLGEGGERLHYWVFGGPWTYENEDRLGEATGEDAAWLQSLFSRIGAVVSGRWTYEAADHWGDENPWGIPVFIVTHRTEEQPENGRSRSYPASRKRSSGRARQRVTSMSTSWVVPTSSGKRWPRASSTN